MTASDGGSGVYLLHDLGEAKSSLHVRIMLNVGSASGGLRAGKIAAASRCGGLIGIRTPARSAQG